MATPAEPAAAAAPVVVEDKVFTLEEVAVHNTEKDCWIIIHNKVYDVTLFLDEHPGGPDIISEQSGVDVTEDFEDTGHSEDARKDLAKYLLGALKVSQGATTPGSAEDSNCRVM